MQCVRCKTKEGFVREDEFGAALCDDCYVAVKSEPRCPRCKTTWFAYQRTGLLGCPACYDFFADRLSGEIYRIQRSVLHFGRQDERSSKYEIANEVRMLDRAIASAQAEGDQTRVSSLLEEKQELVNALFGEGGE